MQSLVERAVETMVNLGITTQAAVAPYVESWVNRPPDDGTCEEDSELAGFLSQLFQSKVITRNQGRTLLAMLTGGAGPATGDDPNVGRRFGSFVAEELIGEGAMGKVYRACRDGTLERDFVVKVFGNVGDTIGMARFRREGDLMASLRHPNIVRVVGSGQEGESAFLVLEYFEGPTLAEMIEQRQRFSWKSATRAVKQIAVALTSAHEKGIIHRDIKPHNVLVAPGGMLKVFDFGLAKAVGSQSGGLSQAGEILGSPAYMAPEQWGDHKVDHRADLFAVGVIYYLLITGETPFKGRTPADYSWKIREGHYDPIAKVVPELPEAVAQVVTQLLETDRAYRTPSAKRLVADLDRVLAGKEPNVPRLEVASGSEKGKRHALVGKLQFSVGKDFESDVFIDGNAIFDAHATLERTEGGPLLVCKGPTNVNGKPVNEIVLRDKDEIVFGESTALRFRVGNIGKRASTRHLNASSDDAPALNEAPGLGKNPGVPLVISGLAATALAASGHQLTLLSAFESMDPYTIEKRLERSRRRLLEGGFAESAVDEIQQRALKLSQERVWNLADALFTTTRENLGRSVEAWLAWWFEVRAKAPRQLRAPGSRARGELKIRPGDGAAKIVVDLGEGEDWVVGRSDDADITIPARSVSRKHVTLHRLLSRYAYVDQGSRFGTSIGGNRVSVGLLRDKDEVILGRARVAFRDLTHSDAAGQTDSGGPNVEVDLDTFSAMVDMRIPAVVLTLARLIEVEPVLAFCMQAIAPYASDSATREGIRTFLDTWRGKALEALPAASGVNFGDDATQWMAWFQANQATLGRQVEPQGWGA